MACSGSTCPLPPFFPYLGLKWDVDVEKAGRHLAPRVRDWGAVLGGPVGCSSTLECNCVWSPRGPLGKLTSICDPGVNDNYHAKYTGKLT